MILSNFITKKDDTINYTHSLEEAINKMIKNKLDYIILLQNNKPYGIFTKEQLIPALFKNTNQNVPIFSVSSTNFITIYEDFNFDYTIDIYSNFDADVIVIVDKEENYLGTIKRRFLLKDPKAKKIFEKKKIKDIQLKPANFIKLPYFFSDIISDFYLENKYAYIIGDKTNIQGLIARDDIHYYLNELKKDKIEKPYSFEHIIFDSNESISEAIDVMNEENTNYLIVKDKEKNEFFILHIHHILSFYNNIKKSSFYAQIQSNHIVLNNIKEGVIEVFEINNRFLISWLNKYSKQNLNLEVNTQIDKILPEKVWENILNSIEKNEYVKEEEIFIVGEYKRLFVDG